MLRRRGHCKLEVDVAPVREERRGGRLELHAAASQDAAAAVEEGGGPPDPVSRHRGRRKEVAPTKLRW
jgi:hypothetical protein